MQILQQINQLQQQMHQQQRVEVYLHLAIITMLLIKVVIIINQVNHNSNQGYSIQVLPHYLVVLLILSNLLSNQNHHYLGRPTKQLQMYLYNPVSRIVYLIQTRTRVHHYLVNQQMHLHNLFLLLILLQVPITIHLLVKIQVINRHHCLISH